MAQVVGHKGKYTPAHLSDDGEEKYEHSTVVGVNDGNIYLSNMTFYGDDWQSRALDVSEGTRAYCGGTAFLNLPEGSTYAHVCGIDAC